MSKGFLEAEMGTKVYANRLQKLGGMKTNERTVISILSRKIKIIKTHYSDDLRYFYCNEGACCEKFGPPSVRYVFPVVHYSTDKQGRIIPDSPDWLVRPLVVGGKDYEMILLKDQVSGDVTEHDLMVICMNDQYQNFQFEVIGPATWKKLPLITGRIKEEVEYYKKNVKTAVARELTDLEILAAMARGGVVGQRTLAIDQPQPEIQAYNPQQVQRQALPAAAAPESVSQAFQPSTTLVPQSQQQSVPISIPVPAPQVLPESIDYTDLFD